LNSAEDPPRFCSGRSGRELSCEIPIAFSGGDYGTAAARED